MIGNGQKWVGKLLAPATALALGLFGATGTVRAANDYEFAKMLMDRDNPSFPTDDLVEHFINQLEAKAETKTEAKLVKATLKRRQANKSTSVEKRKGLLDEADALYKEVLTDKKYKNIAIAQQDAATIVSARITTMIKAANEQQAKNPAEAKKLRGEAIAGLEKIAAEHKADSDAKWPIFKGHYEKFQKWNETENKDGNKAPPADLLTPLQKTFDEWLVPDQKYVNTKLEQINCYEDGDEAKKKLGEEIGKLCAERADAPGVADFPVLVAWYYYSEGKANAFIGDEKKAAEAWQNAQDAGVIEEMAPAQQKRMITIIKLIIHDLVKMKMKLKKYSDVESIYVSTQQNGSLRSIFDEDSGKELIVDYSSAITRGDNISADDYEKAIKELRKAIEKEKGETRWTAEFSRTIAEILDDQRKNNPTQRPKLAAGEWYNAARGFYLLGQQDYKSHQDLAKDDPKKSGEFFDQAYNNYQNAVDYYRRAISVARNEKTDLLSRLQVEPQAWFEMGIAFTKMKHYYEAAIVNNALRGTYLPENRKRWLPDFNKPENRKIAKAAQDILAELDKRDGLLTKAGSNVTYVTDLNTKINKNSGDHWNREWPARLRGDLAKEGFDDGSITDNDYIAGRNDMDSARGYASAGTQEVNKNPKLAEDNFAQALQLYTSAGDKFQKVKSSSPAYEFALFQSGSAYNMAQALWVQGRLPSRAKDGEEQAKLMGQKAVDMFGKYDAHIAKNPSKDENDIKRRKTMEGLVLLARTSLYSGARDWDNVAKSADAYIAWEQKNPQPKSAQNVAMLNKFNALLNLGGAAIAPKCDPFLAQAEKTMRAWRKIVTNDNKTYVFMLDALSRRYTIAGFQVDKFIKEGRSEYTAEMREPYEIAVANLQKERIRLVEEDKTQDTTLEDYARLLYLLDKIQADRETADTAKKMLMKFDPENKNRRIPDDPKVLQDMVAKMRLIIHFEDLNKKDRAAKEHTTLVDYLYDTAEGVNADPAKRPEHDRVNTDMNRARATLETINKNFANSQTMPDAKTGKPMKPEYTVDAWVDAHADKYPNLKEMKGKTYLQVIEEEIDFRQKIIATRELLASRALQVAAKYDKEGDKTSGDSYRETAVAQIDILGKELGETPAMLNKKAEVDISLGKFDDAMLTLNQVKAQSDENSPVYFDASRRISEVLALQKKWEEAAEFPRFIALTAGFDASLVRQRWPSMKLFLKECFDNGAKVPPKLESIRDGSALKGTGDAAEEKPAEAKPADPKPADTPPAEAPKQ